MGDAFYVVVAGTVAIVQRGFELKTYGAGDYFGETSLILEQPRNADVVARTDVTLIELSAQAFHYLVRGTNIPDRLLTLANMRNQDSWWVFDQNSILSHLTAAQKTRLQTYLETVEVEEGDVLWQAGADVDRGFLISEGTVVIEGLYGDPEPFSTGAFLANVKAMRDGDTHGNTARAVEKGRLYSINATDLLEFLDDNPRMLLAIHGARFVE